MTITTRLYTNFYGSFVGEDNFGNKYYTEKKQPKEGRAKRWVIYNGKAEPSKVPGEWFGWLHYTTDKLPDPNAMVKYSWQKPHQPNLTGTKNAYAPSGSLRGTAIHDKTTASYEAWKPE